MTTSDHDAPPEAMRQSLSLLRLEGRNGPIFFVVRSHRSAGAGETDADIQQDREYLYEEHSCPTDWLGDVVMVIQDGDTDPHGVLDHVRSVDSDLPAGALIESAIRALFPEAFAGFPEMEADDA